MITKPFMCVLLSLTALAAAPVHAAGAQCVQLREGWIRLPPGAAAMPMAAGFGQIHNGCDQAVAVVSARSPAFKEVSLHETTQVQGVSRMREVGRLPVAAGQAAELKPGGLHLMLMGGGALQEGQRVALLLTLADGREVPGELVVRKPGG
ncbi:copper chaperone PCu(A)C [Stenotrophomonas sp. YIM B06876]|uniref:copper chaperone PCu(A)C n=1 Tax=Stenotrophomonas sp. YIM B06876 TaxID=3060211 RepID=UPI00273835FB|nr:copper chaperone PCu(A)C [Stenotrophomonas sp. YIM B06876]